MCLDSSGLASLYLFMKRIKNTSVKINENNFEFWEKKNWQQLVYSLLVTIKGIFLKTEQNDSVDIERVSTKVLHRKLIWKVIKSLYTAVIVKVMPGWASAMDATKNWTLIPPDLDYQFHRRLQSKFSC